MRKSSSYDEMAVRKQFDRKHEIIRIYKSPIIFDTIAPNQGGIAYE